MTTDRPDPALPLDQPGVARPLRRRTTDRVIGGVAGGLGDYLNVDPVLFRAAFAGLVIFGGAGAVLYVLGWLLIPEAGQDRSIAELALRRLVRRPAWITSFVVVVAAIVVVRPWGYAPNTFIPPEVFWGLAIALAGVLLMLVRDRSEVRPAAVAVAAPAPRAALRERSPLGWFVLAAALAGVGVLAIVDTAGSVAVTPAQYFGVAILVLGLGLVIASWWGRARPAITVLGLAILPVAAVSWFLTVPLEGGIADDTFRPTNAAELQPAYRLVGGKLRLDLTTLETADEPVVIDASVGVGNLYVMIPQGASVQITGSVRGGTLWLLGRSHGGTMLVDRVAEPGWFGGPRLVLTLDVGLGELDVDRVPAGGY